MQPASTYIPHLKCLPPSRLRQTPVTAEFYDASEGCTKASLLT